MTYNVLTFDCDWCQDRVIEYVLDLLKLSDNPRGVFFLTNRPGRHAMQRLLDDENIQVGVHPNLFGIRGFHDVERVLAEILHAVPEADACRTHGLMWWYDLASILACRGIRYDSSVIAPYQRISSPWIVKEIMQFPIFMGDSFYMNSGLCLKKFVENVACGGALRVFNFHPIHIYCNTSCAADWEEIKSVMGNDYELKRVVEAVAERNQYGVRDLFISFLESLPAGSTYTFIEVDTLHKSGDLTQ